MKPANCNPVNTTATIISKFAKLEGHLTLKKHHSS